MLKAPTPRRIIDATSEYFEIPVEQLLDSSKKARHIAYARHLAMYVTRKKTHMGYVEIAHSFCQKNHASVAYANRQITGLLRYRNTKRDLAAIIANLEHH